MSVAIPSGLVLNGAGIPDVCSPHGEAAALRKPVKFQSKPPVWAYLLIFFGALPFLIVALVLRKEVQAQAWPFCPQCQKSHKNRLIIGLALLALTVLSFVVSGAAGDFAALVVLAAFFLAIAGMIVLVRGTYRALPLGFASHNGAAVEFPKAHPQFAAAAQAAYARAAQQHAARQTGQQAAYQPPQP